ncbi:hypothetical protein Q5752_003205 [Cryptotrichosporon argae]
MQTTTAVTAPPGARDRRRRRHALDLHPILPRVERTRAPRRTTTREQEHNGDGPLVLPPSMAMFSYAPVVGQHSGPARASRTEDDAALGWVGKGDALGAHGSQTSRTLDKVQAVLAVCATWR